MALSRDRTSVSLTKYAEQCGESTMNSEEIEIGELNEGAPVY